jgi:hypothetical protein
MEKVIVRYKLKPGKVEENELLVREVYKQLHQDKPQDLNYATYKFDDGLTFIHVANYKGEGRAPLPTFEAFKNFAAGVKERCDEPPVVNQVTEIGSYGSFL